MPAGASDHAYRTVATVARAQLEERHSRFLAVVTPVADEAAARAAIEASRESFPDASHHCWAWRIGTAAPRERSADAGEPAGTAGEPILRVLRGASLVEVAAVVSRWFGGVKLGRGGLARAYAGAVSAALEEARIVERVAQAELDVEIPFERLGAVKGALGAYSSHVVRERWSATGVCWRLRLPRPELERVADSLRGLRLRPEPRDDGD